MSICVCAIEQLQRLEDGDGMSSSLSLSVPLMQHLPLNLGLVYLRLEARTLGEGVAGIHRRPSLLYAVSLFFFIPFSLRMSRARTMRSAA